MNQRLPKLSDTLKGILLIIIGIILLLHTLGLVRCGLNIIIIVSAIIMIMYGILLASQQKIIKEFIDKMRGVITKK